MDKGLIRVLVVGTLLVCLFVGLAYMDWRVNHAPESGTTKVKRELAIANRQIAELEGHLRVCETTIAWEDSCCAIQSRCLERNAVLERYCSTASPAE